jgi:peroxiredoxin
MSRRTWPLAAGAALLVGAILTWVGTERGRLPRFQAMGLNREPLWASPGTATPTLLVFFCDCDDCRSLARQLTRSRYRWGDGLILMGVIHSTVQEAQQFQQETGFPGTLLVDPNGEVKRWYGVGACPSAWLVRVPGRLRVRRDHVSWPELDRQLGIWLAAGLT